eukprot:TRINITY_DN25671_c1_g2_i1.p1 TRINITY_DN25671_c1_g2~~TRINITY_DN25671_c1_g2_i1.p1  ORF type:complete len:1265 (+),score=287.26 TRINITY_DN25671_c1_g2_i1:3505-7299(+)
MKSYAQKQLAERHFAVRYTCSWQIFKNLINNLFSATDSLAILQWGIEVKVLLLLLLLLNVNNNSNNNNPRIALGLLLQFRIFFCRSDALILVPNMEQYPLIVKIPRAENCRSTLGWSHTEYVVEIDDCGKVYPRLRRYNSFVWLHERLRQKELACALPELPPKKMFGILENAFVERRRQMLEDYLRAFMKTKEVIQDNLIWTFLDADEATAVVPRFLCRPQSALITDQRLNELKKAVADKEADLFRICSPVVLEELSKFAYAEASEAAVPMEPAANVPTQIKQALEARLRSRVRLCDIMLRLVKNERARQGLLTSGAFGALLALLWQVTEDEVKAAPLQRFPQDNLNKAACLKVTEVLLRLIQDSHGVAMLHFCQQDDALNAMKRLATAENLSLHPVAASLIWHGMECAGVITALAGSSTRGLSLLGKLLTSPDLCARIMASLCVASVLRQDGALDEDHREHCLRALAPLPADLHAEEAAAVQRAAARILQQQATATLASGSTPEASFVDGHGQRPLGSPQRDEDFASKSQGTTNKILALEDDKSSIRAFGASQTRDPSLMMALQSIFSQKELPRIQHLLGPCCEDGRGHGGIDTVTAVIVSLLDHFVQHCIEMETGAAANLTAVLVLAPQLQNLVEGCEEDDGNLPVEGGGGSAAAGEPPAPQILREWVRTRAAHTLVRLMNWAPHEGLVRGEPPSLTSIGRRAKILEVLTKHFAVSQEEASARMAVTNERGQQQGEHVRLGSLDQAPCLHQESLQSFQEQLLDLSKRRGELGSEVHSSRMAVEDTLAGLDQRRIKLGVLTSEVEEVFQEIVEQAHQHGVSESSHAALEQHEERQREISKEVDALRGESNETEAHAREWKVRNEKAEALVHELSCREAEMADIRNNAPAQLQRIQAQLIDTQRRRVSLSQQHQEFASEVDRHTRRFTLLREAVKESEEALQNLDGICKDLVVVKRNLNSEIILSAMEVDRLKRLQERMTPTKPRRMRRNSEDYTSGDPENSGGGSASSSFREAFSAEAASAPNWEDSKAEQVFRDTPNYRTFKALCDERLELWTSERAWLQESADRVEAAAAEAVQQRRHFESSERAAIEEEEQLRREHTIVDDEQGHAIRHEEACAALKSAQDAAIETGNETAKANGAWEYAKARLEFAEKQAEEAKEACCLARKEAEGCQQQTLEVRVELQRKFLEIENRIRDHLKEWRALEMEEQRCLLLQEQVNEKLRSEAAGREALRGEVHVLMANLQELDQQLVLGDGFPGNPPVGY